jgi:hypothetical protein
LITRSYAMLTSKSDAADIDAALSVSFYLPRCARLRTSQTP